MIPIFLICQLPYSLRRERACKQKKEIRARPRKYMRRNIRDRRKEKQEKNKLYSKKTMGKEEKWKLRKKRFEVEEAEKWEVLETDHEKDFLQ
nr:MAG TPA: hypothetical protein [Caudoviricetes sp.]